MGRKARDKRLRKAQGEDNKLGASAEEQKTAMKAYFKKMAEQRRRAGQMYLQQCMQKTYGPRRRTPEEIRFGAGVALAMTKMHQKRVAQEKQTNE